MCMEDVRIGRKTVTQTKLVDLTGSAVTLLVPQSRDRVALRFRFGSNATVHIFPWVSATLPAVLTLGGNAADEVKADIWHDADAVTQPWYASMGAGNGMVYVTEVFLEAQ